MTIFYILLVLYYVMAIVLLPISFLIIFLITGISKYSGPDKKETIIISVLIFSVVLFGITEILSLFKLLILEFVLISWGLVLISGFAFLIPHREKVLEFCLSIKQEIQNSIRPLKKSEKILIISVIILLGMVLLQGIVYPPNNYDSLNYHLARIPNWISHHSIAHYPTHIIYQIYHPPFAEFVIMHFNLLNGGDYFSNSVQFFFLLFSLVSILSIVQILNLKRKDKIIALVLCATIPEALLEASSTQNDIVLTFFILTSVYFSIKTAKDPKLRYYFLIGLSTGIGILTKGTAYIYFAPMLLILGISVLVKTFRMKNYAYLWYSFIAVILIIGINSGHYYRNYSLSKNILGVDDIETRRYSNERMNPVLLLSSIVKNMGLHVGPRPINKVADRIIYDIHSMSGVDINNPETNFRNLPYHSPSIPNHEDTAPNPIHFVLVFISFLLIALNSRKNKMDRRILLYAAMIMLQGLLFCAYLKWQPYHSRLHMPLFMLSIPLICYSLNINNLFKNIVNYLIPVIILYAAVIVIFNETRPVIRLKGPTMNISMMNNRYEKYFVNTPYAHEEYANTIQKLRASNHKNIGLILGVEHMEYPIFCHFYGEDVNPIHINVTNITKNLTIESKNIDCIISTTLDEPFIAYNGRLYHNKSRENRIIYIYE